MTTPATTPPKASRKKLTRLLVILVLSLVIITLAGVLLWRNMFHNYAAEVAAPVETSLATKNAVEVCVKGDPGRGPDNTQPWHQAYFQLRVGHEEAVLIARDAASKNGYLLTQATTSNRGPVSVDDKFLSNWYFDNTSKVSPYTDLESGSVQMIITVDADGSDKVCGASTPLVIDAGHSVISVDVTLPNFKR